MNTAFHRTDLYMPFTIRSVEPADQCVPFHLTSPVPGGDRVSQLREDWQDTLFDACIDMSPYPDMVCGDMVYVAYLGA